MPDSDCMVPPFVFTKVRKNIESKHFHIKKKSVEELSVPCNEMLCKPDKAAAAVITAPKGIVMLQSI